MYSSQVILRMSKSVQAGSVRRSLCIALNLVTWVRYPRESGMTCCLVGSGRYFRAAILSLVNHNHWLQTLTWLSSVASFTRASQRGQVARGAKPRTVSMTCITASFALSCGRHDVVDADMMAAIELCYPARQSALGYCRWLNRNAERHK